MGGFLFDNKIVLKYYNTIIEKNAKEGKGSIPLTVIL